MIIYDSAKIYIESKSSLIDKIKAIDSVIAALTTGMLDVAANGGISSYSLDNGQTKINQTYRDPESITRSIKAFMSIKNIYLSDLNKDRKMRMVDEHNLTRWNNGQIY